MRLNERKLKTILKETEPTPDLSHIWQQIAEEIKKGSRRINEQKQ